MEILRLQYVSTLDKFQMYCKPIELHEEDLREFNESNE